MPHVQDGLMQDLVVVRVAKGLRRERVIVAGLAVFLPLG